MTAIMARELGAPYQYVIAEDAVRDATRLLEAETKNELAVSDWYRRIQPARGHSILELKGLGKEIWAGVDPKKYIDELRGSPDEGRVVPPGLRDPAERRRRLADLVAWLRSNPLSAGAPHLTREDLHERR